MWLVAAALDSVDVEDAEYIDVVPQHRAFLERCLSCEHSPELS